MAPRVVRRRIGSAPLYVGSSGNIVVDPRDIPGDDGDAQAGYDDGYESGPSDEDEDEDEDEEAKSDTAGYRSVGEPVDVDPKKHQVYLNLRLLDDKRNTVGYTAVQVHHPNKLWHLAFALHLHLPMPTAQPHAYATQVRWPFDVEFAQSLGDGAYAQIALAGGLAQSTMPVYYDASAKEPALVVDLDLNDPEQSAAPPWAGAWDRRGVNFLQIYTLQHAAYLKTRQGGYSTTVQEGARAAFKNLSFAHQTLPRPAPTPEPPTKSPFQATGALALGGAKRAGTMILATRAISPLRAMVRSLVSRFTPEQRALLDSPAGEVLLDLATPLVLHGLAGHGLLPGGALLQSTAALAYEGHLVHHGMQIADGLVDVLTRSPQELAAVRVLAAEVVAKSVAGASEPEAPAEASVRTRAPRKRRVKERAL